MTTGMSMGESLLQLASLIMIFAGILVLTYWVTKKLAQVKQGTMLNKNMKVVESTVIGPGQYLHIVKVGTGYHLIGATKEHLTYCQQLDETTLNLEEVPFKSFKEQLAQFKPTKQENDDENTQQS